MHFYRLADLVEYASECIVVGVVVLASRRWPCSRLRRSAQIRQVRRDYAIAVAVTDRINTRVAADVAIWRYGKVVASLTNIEHPFADEADSHQERPRSAGRWRDGIRVRDWETSNQFTCTSNEQLGGSADRRVH